MLRRILETEADPAGLVLRLTLALVMFPHGAQKLLGWFGGFGLEGSLGYFTGTLGIPLVLAWLAILTEFVGPLGLATGLLARPAALGVGSIMVVSGVLGWLRADPASAYLPSGFFMNWFGQRQGEGLEFHILAAALSAAIVFRGAGVLSLDRWLSRRLVHS
jgi:putative oxidoreductase